MFIDGVMRDTITNAPIPQGMSLYRMIKEKQRVLLLCDDKTRADRWLREHKLSLFDDLVDKSIAIGSDFPELRQVEHCRGLGSIEYVITSDPELAAKLLEIGISSLMFLHPVYLTEKFRPDSKRGAKAWSEIREEIVKQQEAFLEDDRIQ